MFRTLKLRRLIGYSFTAIGVAMVAVSAYYVIAYMMSGSDAEKFNLDLSDETRAVLLGESAPRPGNKESPLVVVQSSDSDPGIRGTKPAVSISYPEDLALGDTEIALYESLDFAADDDERSAIVSPPRRSQPDSPESVRAAVPDPLVSDDGAMVHSRSGASSFVVSADATGTEDEFLVSEVAATDADFEVNVNMFASLYPGGNMNPRYWSDPLWAGNMPYGVTDIPPGFIPVSSSDISNEPSRDSRGVMMRIPSIGLEAAVEELEILDLGDSRQWSTPDRVVGHIPSTANPGETNNGWYFGHLDNFISNEGDIFRRLPEISEMIRFDPVDIFIQTEEAEYMYRVTGTRQMHRDELRITESDDAQIVLVTCWPFRVYDHRVLVSASLIAMKPLSEN